MKLYADGYQHYSTRWLVSNNRSKTRRISKSYAQYSNKMTTVITMRKKKISIYQKTATTKYEVRVNRWCSHLGAFKILHENKDIKYSTINSHDDVNVESIARNVLSGSPERLGLLDDFEISKFIDLTKKP